MFEIEIKDELGTHLLQSNRDCSWVCPNCRHEIRVTKRHLDKDNKLVRPKCSKCKESIMKFHYWLDCMD